jgi:NAD(P)-dependent dehydrogenase (short-subunit alcohol dehydrogenase family)
MPATPVVSGSADEKRRATEESGTPETEFDREHFAITLSWLEQAAEAPLLLSGLTTNERNRLLTACGRLAHPSPSARKARTKALRKKDLEERRSRDKAMLTKTRIRQQRIDLVYPTPDPTAPQSLPHGTHSPGCAEGPRLTTPRSCYICKVDYREVHSFYDSMCPECAAFNLKKRHQTADLSGRVALLTGGRVKIGYQAGIKLLRAGARLIVTTRFPRDAARRYSEEKDFASWRERLEIYGLDLRYTASVEMLCEHIGSRYDRLDFILNNACQTVRKPPAFYAHLMEQEQLGYSELPEHTHALIADHEALRRRGGDAALAPGVPLPEGSLTQGSAGEFLRASSGLDHSAALSQVPLVPGDDHSAQHHFPCGQLDADQQQIDQREVNSWRLPLEHVPTVELLEVQLVNAVGPFVLNARLKHLMKRHPSRDKHIVNVSAMEGQFYRSFKTDKHPHTNMAKAALNMMTRTSAPDYLKDGIHMNSVDTGWITDEDPLHITLIKQNEHGFHPPLDHVDAAARICAPIFDGFLTGSHLWGQFIKDYKPARW